MNYLRISRSVSQQSRQQERTDTPTPRQSIDGSAADVSGRVDSSQASLDSTHPVVTSRSRASSIFSTGTKTSINTLPPQPPPHAESHAGPIDVVLGRRNFRITARPGSILSISSFDYPAPPYTEAIGGDASQSTATLTAVSFQTGDEQQEYGNDDESEPGHVETDLDNATGDELEMPASIQQPVPVVLHAQPLILQTTGHHDYPSSVEPIHDADDRSPTRTVSPPSPPMSPLSSSTNAISAHYTAVVRTIDSNHRAELERLQREHHAALAQTRNDIDAAYRLAFREERQRAASATAEAERCKQLAEERAEQLESLILKQRATEKELAEIKASSEMEIPVLRDEIAALKAATAQMKSSVQADVLRARNQVEDVWEGRWRDRMRLAAEQVHLSWEDGRKTGWHEGVLQGCRYVADAWERTNDGPMPKFLQDEIDLRAEQSVSAQRP